MKNGMLYYDLLKEAKDILNEEEFIVYLKIANYFINNDECTRFVKVYKRKPKNGVFKIKIYDRFLSGDGRYASWCNIDKGHYILQKENDIKKLFILEGNKKINEFIVLNYDFLKNENDVHLYLDEMLIESILEKKIINVCNSLKNRYYNYNISYDIQDSYIGIYNKQIELYIDLKYLNFENKKESEITDFIICNYADVLRYLLYECKTFEEEFKINDSCCGYKFQINH